MTLTLFVMILMLTKTVSKPGDISDISLGMQKLVKSLILTLSNPNTNQLILNIALATSLL